MPKSKVTSKTVKKAKAAQGAAAKSARPATAKRGKTTVRATVKKATGKPSAARQAKSTTRSGAKQSAAGRKTDKAVARPAVQKTAKARTAAKTKASAKTRSVKAGVKAESGRTKAAASTRSKTSVKRDAGRRAAQPTVPRKAKGKDRATRKATEATAKTGKAAVAARAQAEQSRDRHETQAKAEAQELAKRMTNDKNEKKKPLQRQGFRTNEYIVYPAHGVGQITEIEEQEVAGLKLELIVINFEKDKLTLRVPTTKVHSVGMRKLSDPDVLQKALDTLKGRARVKRTMWSRRAQEYEAKINSGDLISIAEVVRDLHRLDSQPEQSYSERQLYEAALDRMAREYAAVRKVDEASAVAAIEEILTKSPKRARAAQEEPEKEVAAA